jgi:YfiH family protein
MRFCEIGNRRYAQFERLREQADLRHACSTRPADMSVRCDARRAERAARRRQMAADLGLDADRVYYCVQIHDTSLALIDGSQPAAALNETDAVITSEPGVALLTFSADCPLVLAYDPVRGAVGMTHASWRCTVAGATRRLIEALRRHFGCDPKDMLAGVGPAAGPCCYEVQRDVYEAAAELAARDELFEERDGRLHFDLPKANRAQLLEAGVPPQNVELAEICTLCNNDVFYSYRREGAGCGHFGLMAGLLPAGRSGR